MLDINSLLRGTGTGCPREAVDAPLLKVFRASVDGALIW